MARAFASLIIIVVLAGVALVMNALSVHKGPLPGLRASAGCISAVEAGRAPCRKTRGSETEEAASVPLPPPPPERQAKKRPLPGQGAAPGLSPIGHDDEQIAQANSPAWSDPVAAPESRPVAAATNETKPSSQQAPVISRTPIRQAAGASKPVEASKPANLARAQARLGHGANALVDRSRPDEDPAPIRQAATRAPLLVRTPVPLAGRAQARLGKADERVGQSRAAEERIARSEPVREVAAPVARRHFKLASAPPAIAQSEPRVSKDRRELRTLEVVAPEPTERPQRFALRPPAPRVAEPQTRSGGSQFPADFQSVLSEHNTRYSMFSGRARASDW